MATQEPHAMLVAISSPHMRKGVAYERWKKYYGQNGSDVLVWVAPTRVMNPTISQAIVDRALERDPQAAASEYLAQWREGLASFVSREAIDAAVDHGVLERAPDRTLTYFAHCDPSGGSNDSMALALSHLDRDGVAVLDCVREFRPPFSPKAVVADCSAVLDAYNVRVVMGDRWGGVWPAEIFRDHGITYEVCSRTASEGYLAFLPLLNSNRIRLLDHARLLAQFSALERRVSPSGRDLVTHPRFFHDDCCNAAGLALVAAADHARSDDSQIMAANLSAAPRRQGLSSHDVGDADASPLLPLGDAWDDFAAR